MQATTDNKKSHGVTGKVVIVGVCRVCGCTELSPCMEGGLRCGWVDAAHTLCDNLQCIAKVSIGELERMVPAEAIQ